VIIEILHVPECPHLTPAVEMVRRVLAAERLSAEIRTMLITDESGAQRERFPGSPTIRVDGRDVDPEGAGAISLSCRLYPGSAHPGLPAEETVRRALRAGAERQ